SGRSAARPARTRSPAARRARDAERRARAFPRRAWERVGKFSPLEHTMRRNAVKQALQAGQPSVGTWLSLGSITAARFLARAGFAWLTVDMEHSLVGWESATHLFAVIAEAGCTALLRVPSGRHD